MAKELSREKPGGKNPPEAKNAPPEGVKGSVTRVDEKSGLLTISVGSDAGLQKGHTLEVYRLKPPKYLGTIRIVDVSPKEAVAQPVGKALDAIQVGDEVASKIGDK
jgi:hypothetical protein